MAPPTVSDVAVRPTWVTACRVFASLPTVGPRYGAEARYQQRSAVPLDLQIVGVLGCRSAAGLLGFRGWKQAARRLD
jgi:hypothetical protein